MQHRPFGNTGNQVSILGFGAMRLPAREAMEIGIGEVHLQEGEVVGHLRRRRGQGGEALEEVPGGGEPAIIACQIGTQLAATNADLVLHPYRA